MYLLYMLAGLGNAQSLKGCAMAASIAAAAVCALRFRHLRERIRLPFVALFLVLLMGGASTLYATAGKFALGEFLQMLIGMDAALLLTALTPDTGFDSPGGKSPAERSHMKGTESGRPDTGAAGIWMAAVLEGAGALLAVVNVDLQSTRWISGCFMGFLHPFTQMYEEAAGAEHGVRLLSMFGSPNAFAGLMGVLVLLSLGLCASTLPDPAGRNRYARSFHLACLFAESMTFVLVFSMGAAAILAPAFLLYLLLRHFPRSQLQ
jgi:hypothetical protein